MINMYNVQPSSIYIFKRRPPRADPQTEAGKNAAMPRLRHVSGRAASADAQWLRPRPPGPCLDDFWGVVQICLACLWMMDDGLLLKVFDVVCCYAASYYDYFCSVTLSQLNLPEGSNFLALEPLHGLVGGRKLVVLHCSMS